MALRYEPSRFFLKGKVTQKQTSYKHVVAERSSLPDSRHLIIIASLHPGVKWVPVRAELVD